MHVKDAPAFGALPGVRRLGQSGHMGSPGPSCRESRKDPMPSGDRRIFRHPARPKRPTGHSPTRTTVRTMDPDAQRRMAVVSPPPKACCRDGRPGSERPAQGIGRQTRSFLSTMSKIERARRANDRCGRHASFNYMNKRGTCQQKAPYAKAQEHRALRLSAPLRLGGELLSALGRSYFAFTLEVMEAITSEAILN